MCISIPRDLWEKHQLTLGKPYGQLSKLEKAEYHLGLTRASLEVAVRANNSQYIKLYENRLQVQQDRLAVLQERELAVSV